MNLKEKYEIYIYDSEKEHDLLAGWNDEWLNEIIKNIEPDIIKKFIDMCGEPYEP